MDYVQWGTFENQYDYAVHVCPCDKEGYTDHLLGLHCWCSPDKDGDVIVHNED